MIERNDDLLDISARPSTWPSNKLFRDNGYCVSSLLIAQRVKQSTLSFVLLTTAKKEISVEQRTYPHVTCAAAVDGNIV